MFPTTRLPDSRSYVVFNRGLDAGVTHTLLTLNYFSFHSGHAFVAGILATDLEVTHGISEVTPVMLMAANVQAIGGSSPLVLPSPMFPCAFGLAAGMLLYFLCARSLPPN